MHKNAYLCIFPHGLHLASLLPLVFSFLPSLLRVYTHEPDSLAARFYELASFLNKPFAQPSPL